MKVAVFETTLAGHHWNYLSNISRILFDAGKQVYIYLPDSSRAEFQGRIIGLRWFEHVNIVYYCPVPTYRPGHLGEILGSLHLWIRCRMEVAHSIALNGISQIYLPYFDAIARAVLILGNPFSRFETIVLYMRPYLPQELVEAERSSACSKLLRYMVFARLSLIFRVTRIFLIDLRTHKYIHDKYPRLATPFHYLPDPAHELTALTTRDRAQHRNEFGLTEDSLCILAFGAISFRKGISVLVECLGSRREVLGKWRILLVGKHDREFAAFLETDQNARILKNSGCLMVVDRYVSDQESSIFFGISDVVWAGYLGHVHMSGVIVQAGLAEKPVLSCQEGLIGWYALQFGTGYAVAVDPVEIASALKKLEQIEVRTELGSRGLEVFRKHNWTTAGMTLLRESPCH